jgi:hypothetical protein
MFHPIWKQVVLYGKKILSPAVGTSLHRALVIEDNNLFRTIFFGLFIEHYKIE